MSPPTFTAFSDVRVQLQLRFPGRDSRSPSRSDPCGADARKNEFDLILNNAFAATQGMGGGRHAWLVEAPTLSLAPRPSRRARQP